MSPKMYRKNAIFGTSTQVREGGGFLVRKAIGQKIKNVDPFLMLDHFGPVVYGPGEAVGAPDHPHRGFEAVSYMIDGGVHHKDSAGNEGNLGPGWCQWMTAGSGVVHSEMPTEELLKNGGRMEGFQLWVNLPKKFKMVPPRYQDTPPEKIPIVRSPDGKTVVKVIAGEFLGTKANIETQIPIMYLDVQVSKGSVFEVQVPETYNGFAYVWRGEGKLGPSDQEAKMGDVALFGEGNAYVMKASATSDMHVLVIAGEPIKEPVARYGPFVMNTMEEIEQAFDDYRSGKLGKIEGADERYALTDAAVQKSKKSGSWHKQGKDDL